MSLPPLYQSGRMTGPVTQLLGHRYCLLDQVGSSGMGAIYCAHDRLTGETVALKHVATRPAFTADASEMRMALTQEFQALASLRHPHIIAVRDYGFDHEQRPFFTMELRTSASFMIRPSCRRKPCWGKSLCRRSGAGASDGGRASGDGGVVMSLPLVERLEKARRQQFVGRTAERDLFRAALAAEELPFVMLYLFGPGGTGKTSLLREYAHIAGEAGARTVYLDGRNVNAAPDFFVDALRLALELHPEAEVVPAMASGNGRAVILIDTYELLTPIDGWLRDTFLPQMPANVLVVLAGRRPPALAWRADPGWQTMMRVLPLGNLSANESREYLQRRQVPANQHEAVMNFTHGHALALSLVADLLAQQPGEPFRPETAPDVIKALLEKLIRQVPTPDHRAALEACALIRLTTESLLAELLPATGVRELFEWLRGLSFIDADPGGLFPHDLAREALTADLRWRNPDWYRELHDRARLLYGTVPAKRPSGAAAGAV